MTHCDEKMEDMAPLKISGERDALDQPKTMIGTFDLRVFLFDIFGAVLTQHRSHATKLSTTVFPY
jgi:hypothetical protein